MSEVKYKINRPNIFSYLDYHSFLKDMITYSKNKKHSLNQVAQESQISLSYLSMILSGIRSLTPDSAQAISKGLRLRRNEEKFLTALAQLKNGANEQERLKAYEMMNRIKSFRSTNPNESVSFQYLSHWYYVAIRELADVSDFILDAHWIQNRLRHPVEIKEIEKAIQFLVQHKLLIKNEDGTTAHAGESINYHGNNHKHSLTEFHKSMFNLAIKSIDADSSDERNILGYTLSLNQEQVSKVKEIINEAQRKIDSIAKESTQNKEEVIQVEFALFPLSKKKDSK